MSLPLPPLRKKPFVRFLISVYMSSDRDQEDRSGSGVTLSHGKYDHSLTPFSPHSLSLSLFHYSHIWTYLGHVADLLKDTAGAIFLLSSEENKEGRRQQLKTKKGIRPSSQVILPPIKKVIPGVTGESLCMYNYDVT